MGYVQKIVVKAAVYPWKSDFLVPTDAFRAPLGKVFDIIQELDQIRYKDGYVFILSFENHTLYYAF